MLGTASSSLRPINIDIIRLCISLSMNIRDLSSGICIVNSNRTYFRDWRYALFISVLFLGIDCISVHDLAYVLPYAALLGAPELLVHVIMSYIQSDLLRFVLEV